MCTLILLRRPDHDWPLIVAANRDEHTGRQWDSPDRHWPAQPDVVAGIDRLAGGSWLGLNDAGVLAAIMNRRGTLGPQPDKHSRGELVLRALSFDSATLAATALTELDPAHYQSFNLVIADRHKAFWVCHKGNRQSHDIVIHTLLEGLTMLTSKNPNNLRSPRIRTYLPRFQRLAAPDPAVSGGWADWADVLSDRSHEVNAGPEGAMNVISAHGYGTVSSSLLALPARHRSDLKPVWLFAPGHPDRMSYREVPLTEPSGST